MMPKVKWEFHCWISSRSVPAKKKTNFPPLPATLGRFPINSADMPCAFSQRGNGRNWSEMHCLGPAPCDPSGNRLANKCGSGKTSSWTAPYASSVLPTLERAAGFARVQPLVLLPRWNAIAWWIAEPQWNERRFCPVPIWRRACSFATQWWMAGTWNIWSGVQWQIYIQLVWGAGYRGVARADHHPARFRPKFCRLRTASRRGALPRPPALRSRGSRGSCDPLTVSLRVERCRPPRTAERSAEHTTRFWISGDRGFIGLSALES